MKRIAILLAVFLFLPQNACGLWPDGSPCLKHSDCESGWCSFYGQPSTYGGSCCKNGEKCCPSHEINAPLKGFDGEWYVCGHNFYLVKDLGTTTTQETTTTTTIRYTTTTLKVMTTTTVKMTSTSTTTSTTTSLGLVVSIEPKDDAEAEEIKKLIEDEIYPAIVSTFDKDSRKVFTGPREYKQGIHLKMTSSESVASWLEGSNVLTIPYQRMYVQMGMYKPKAMQLNALAHELTHYHMNGFALERGGDYNKVPKWFREGICEYGAHSYMKGKLKDVPSVSEARRNVMVGYLADDERHYKETVEAVALDKVSWTTDDDMDASYEDYDHLYYGGAFSFIDYYIKKPRVRDARMDLLKYMFIRGSNGEFKFYVQVGGNNAEMTEEQFKKEWFNEFDRRFNIRGGLSNEPTVTGQAKSIMKDIGSLISGLLRRVF
ncbi:MAG: hypothetical protein ABIH11_08745 [Candidatus Altiarchaeota archaeon]